MENGCKQLMTILRKNILFLNEEQNYNLASKIKEKLNIKKSATYFQIMGVFTNQNLVKFILNYIERNVTMVFETKNFLELDFVFLSKILASSELNITSELQVHNAASSWLNFKYKERLEFASSLIMKIRIPLLTDANYESLKVHSSLLSLKNTNRLQVVKKCLNDGTHLHNKSSTTRHNSQGNYDFAILHGFYNDFKFCLNIQKACGKDFKNKTQITEKTFNFKCLYDSVYANGNLYVFGANKSFQTKFFVQKYSIETKTWIEVPGFKVSHLFGRICVYANKIYFIGGSNTNYASSSSECFSLDTIENSYNFNVENMKTPRNFFACTVFQEKIIASGGYGDRHDLKTVEAYDSGSNTWSYVQSMNEVRANHGLVAINNKMFVFGGMSKSCEMFDSFSNKYVFLKQPPDNIQFNLASTNIHTAFAIGKKVFIFEENSKMVVVYSLDKDEWIEQSLDLAEQNMDCFVNCVQVFFYLKLPQI